MRIAKNFIPHQLIQIIRRRKEPPDKIGLFKESVMN